MILAALKIVRVDVPVDPWLTVTAVVAALGAALVAAIFIWRATRRKGPPPLPR